MLRSVLGDKLGLDKTDSLLVKGPQLILNHMSAAPAALEVVNGTLQVNGLPVSSTVPQNLILDCQFVSDVFPSALRLLAWAHKIGVINLVAVTNCAGDASTSPNPAAQVASQILTTAGVTGVPLSSGPTTTTFNGTESESLTTFLAQAFVPKRRLLTIAGLNTSVPVLRYALANATSPVVICTGGPLNNLYDLLNSVPDSISPLTGAQLIAQKVSTLYTMGGQYPQSTAPVGGEYNFGNVSGFTATLWPATNAILTSWPTPIVFVGFELGPFASCGAYYALTPTDPVGYYYANWSQSTAGRHGWNEIVALIALAGPAKAGFATVSGTNSFNVSTGFNTFTPGAGTHSYVIPLVSQRAIQQACDAINAPGVTQPSTYVQVAEIVPTTPATSAQIDGANLINWYYAPDIAQTNGTAVTSWADRCGRANLVQATAALQPTYNTALVSKAAVSFDGTNDALVGDASIDIPHNCTLYAYVECNAFDTTFDTIMTHGASSGSTDIRNIFMDRSRTNDSPASSPKANSVIQNTFTNAIATSPLVLNTWAVIAIVRNGGTISSYLNGAAAGSTSIATPANFDGLFNAVSNHIVGPLTVGSQYVDASPAGINPWNGGIREIRIYNNAHSAATVASVSTAMTT
jgi:hypothetical protein